MRTFCRMSKLSTRAGFTLLELLVVIGIVSILATIALPILKRYVVTTKNARSMADIRTIEKAIAAYSIEKNSLPPTLADVGMSNQLDPWGQSYVYVNHSLGGTPLKGSNTLALNEDYDLCSGGADGTCSDDYDIPNSQDDIVRHDSGLVVGMRP